MLFPEAYSKLEDLVVAIINKCQAALEASTKTEEMPYKNIICRCGRPKAQHDEELKNIIFVVFYESDTRMQGNEDKHAVLPTSAEVMTAATDAPRMEQAIVMLVAHAMVSYRAPSIRQSYTLAVATKEEASRNADADAIAEERNKRYAPANAVMVKLNAVLFDPPATPDGNATGSGGKKASSRNTAARKPQK